MDYKKFSRRHFLAMTSAGTISAMAVGSIPRWSFAQKASIPALLGGQPVRTKKFTKWPIWDKQDEKAILPVLRSGIWSRNNVVTQAEEKFANLMGSKYCLLTTNGTNALVTSLHTLGVEGGDEVITTPYTFVATIDAIMLKNALPVFVDIDPETWMMDADQIESKINSNTKAILPVHITGGICHMDKINAIARKYNLKVVEDACESHLAEWNGKKAGTLGDLGCFSLQNGKEITCGEGGAILGQDERIMDLCYSYHNFGRSRGQYMPRDKGASPILGTKCRMAEYQASILITQMETSKEETRKRSENAKYLTSKIKDIPGITPRKDYKQTNVTAYYYYGLRFNEKEFGLSRDMFVKAMEAEGIHTSTGLGVIEGGAMHQEGVIESVLNTRTFQKLFSKKRLDDYRDSLSFPKCEQLVKETIGFSQYALLGPKSDVDDIANAMIKVYENRDKLKKLS